MKQNLQYAHKKQTSGGIKVRETATTEDRELWLNQIKILEVAVKKRGEIRDT